MKIGLFGGTFDPPHLGHLILAERCREAAALDEVWFLPSFKPPHKLNREMSRFEYRCEMVQLAVAGHTAFKVITIERDLPPPSFTTETLRVLKEQNPTYDYSLIVGGDSLRDFHTWHKPEVIVSQCRIIAVSRPNVNYLSTQEFAQSIKVDEGKINLLQVESPLVDIASREIRHRTEHHQTVRYLVPHSVEVYIREKKLYLNSAKSS